MKHRCIRFSLPFMLLVLAQALVGCASVQLRPAPLANVHKAAIVAFGFSVDLSTESDKNSSSAVGDIVNASKAIAEASARTGRRVQMHLLETKRQREFVDKTLAAKQHRRAMRGVFRGG